jgi:hypothetical protein
MELNLELEKALKSENPQENLRILVKNQIEKGIKREIIYEELNQFHVYLIKQERETDDELILDVTDALLGWVHPDYVL